MPLSRCLLLIRALFVPCLLAIIFGVSHGQNSPQTQAPTATRSQSPSQWDDYVSALAAKIANVAGRAKAISLDVKNISSLTPADLSAIRASLETELTRRRFRLVSEPDAEARVIVTLSENVQGYVWIAELRTESSDRVEIVSVPKLTTAPENTPGPTLVLEKKLIWQQQAKFIDFALLPANGGSASTLVILEPDRLAFYNSPDSSTWRAEKSIPVPHSTPWPRDPRGAIHAQPGEVDLANVRCDGTVTDPDTLRCATTAQPQPAPAESSVKVPGHEDSETALLAGRCGEQAIVLSTGNGDWTQPDFIQGFLLPNAERNAEESAAQNARASGDPLQFDGPVVSLLPQPEPNAARALVLDLRTGNYGAYAITANCTR